MEFKKQVVKFYLDHHTVKETLQEFHAVSYTHLTLPTTPYV